ncbi:hypothetical protein GOP47_0026025 [Adiantum capillus-veneris]|uniref:Uncharacterized protein n=1 Tax=Adiantum capillus-veneris TaxID=13818 RepID=A0A9D4U156_ADICA|nr:hypothetical protein GOP47_0026025 [Adiantum capillus-veneris]
MKVQMASFQYPSLDVMRAEMLDMKARLQELRAFEAEGKDEDEATLMERLLEEMMGVDGGSNSGAACPAFASREPAWQADEWTAEARCPPRGCPCREHRGSLEGLDHSSSEQRQICRQEAGAEGQA